jgi:hypothetical protein
MTRNHGRQYHGTVVVTLSPVGLLGDILAQWFVRHRHRFGVFSQVPHVAFSTSDGKP